jgi:hypothetical protein
MSKDRLLVLFTGEGSQGKSLFYPGWREQNPNIRLIALKPNSDITQPAEWIPLDFNTWLAQASLSLNRANSAAAIE